jgi:hypothetical protein
MTMNPIAVRIQYDVLTPSEKVLIVDPGPKVKKSAHFSYAG